MARSSRRRGEKIPGVSTKMSCAAPSMAMPRTSVRVVCTFGVTIEILAPTSALISVDLPTFGAPISATKPQRVVAPLARLGPPPQPSRRAGLTPSRASMAAAAACSAARLERPEPSAGAKFGQLHGDAEFRTVVGPGARDLAIDRRRQAARLRPFLQYGLGIAQRLRGRLHANLPQPLDQALGGLIAAVEIDRADQRLADVGQDRRALAARRHWLPTSRAGSQRRARW